MEKEPELIVMHESAIESIISDIFTYAGLLGAFWVNYTYIGNSMMMQLIITVTIIASSVGYVRKVPTTIRGKENIIKFLREYETNNT